MNTLTIPRQVVNQLLHHAQTTVAACGYISVSNQHVSSCQPASLEDLLEHSLDNEKHLSYYFTSQQEKPDLNWLQTQHLAQIGLYYLFICLNTKGVMEINAYRYESRGFEALILQLQEEFN